MTEPAPSGPVAQPKRYRFGLRWLLLVTLMFSLVFAGFARESHRAQRQTRLVNELAQLDVRVRASEPTGLALLIRKAFGEQDAWLTQRIGEGWLSRPSELVTWTATDEQIPRLAASIVSLSSVRELHLEESPVTEQGLAALRARLPGVALLTRSDLLARKSGPPREQFATAAVQLLVLAAASLFGITVILAWPWIRWRRAARHRK